LCLISRKDEGSFGRAARAMREVSSMLVRSLACLLLFHIFQLSESVTWFRRHGKEIEEW
jgi:hypothetical protein